MNFLKFLFVSITLSFFLSCNKGDEPLPDCSPISDDIELSFTQSLFIDLAFREEFGQPSERLRKWNQPIFVFIEFVDVEAVTSEVLDEVDEVIAELSALSTSVTIEKVQDRDLANVRVFLGEKEDYVQMVEPNAAGFAEGNSGFAAIAWNNDFEIIRASACIDVVNNSGDQIVKHILREELAQTLGLINDTNLDENSIFHQTILDAVAYSARDQTIIGEMLGSDLQPGMCETEAIEIIQ